MSNIQIRNNVYQFKGAHDLPITADLTYDSYAAAVPIVLFLHGFKGFKDWGAWPLAAEIFASKGLPFFKINFSHNGTTPDHLMEFANLEAFGNNNFKIEYDEVGLTIDFIQQNAETFDFAWNGEIHIVGHSRGGTIALLCASQDSRISSCCTWSAVSDLERYLELKDFKDWQQENVHYIDNARTGQKMPIYFQFIEAYASNAAQLNVSTNLEKLVCPLLIVHGDQDKVVPLENALTIYKEVPHSILAKIEAADHTYGIKHPLQERKITKQFAEVLTETIEFLTL